MNFFKRVSAKDPMGSNGTEFDSRENLARECREFYEKRLQMAEEASVKWTYDSSISSSSATNSPRSTPKSVMSFESGSTSPASSKSSTLPRKLQFDKHRTSRRSVDDFLAMEDEEEKPPNNNLFDPEVLPNKINQLRQDMLSLINLDNELFKQLLTINDTLEELKEQRVSRLPAPTAAQEPTEVNFKLDAYEVNDEVFPEEYTGPFASLPDHSYMLQKQQLLSQQQQQGGLKNGLKFMLRSRSFLMKPIIAKRRVSGQSEKTKIPVKVPTQHQPKSLPFIQENTAANDPKKVATKSARATTTTSTYSRPIFHLPHQSRSKQLWQKVFDADDFPKASHAKQNSLDSGIHTSSD